jgi:hypothetical protein
VGIGSSGGDADRHRGFARELARCGGLAARILETHTDDGTGHCRRCPAGHDQSGRLTHPCNLRLAATEALVIQGRRQLDGSWPDEGSGRG